MVVFRGMTLAFLAGSFHRRTQRSTVDPPWYLRSCRYGLFASLRALAQERGTCARHADITVILSPQITQTAMRKSANEKGLMYTT
jgi:hypothetical protein